jgi:1,4-dihydroxy-2-naphthoate octaprenyltransferase
MTTSQPSSVPLSRAQIWLLAARPKTLWASIAPVIVGCSVAWRDGVFHWPSALAALAGGVLIQIGTNLANDLFDHLHGADTHERTGPVRVTQSGLATPAQVRNAMIAIFGLAFLIGIYLVSRGGWPIVWIGLFSIASAILYTGGPYPLGYHGWGDLFVFIFFGPVAVVGTYYVQAHAAPPAIWWASVPMGVLATAVLVVNNLRDLNTDRRAGKHTLAVKLGRYGTIGEYATLLIVAALAPGAMVLLHLAPYSVLGASMLVLIFMPLMIKSASSSPTSLGPVLNQLLARTAQLQALFAIAFAIGINL